MYGQLVNILSHFLAKVIIESAIFRDTSQLITSTLIDYLEWNLISFEIGIIRLQRLIFDNVISSIESPLLSNNPTKFVFHHSPSLREEDSEIPQLGIRRDPSIDSKKKLDVKSSPTTSAKSPRFWRQREFFFSYPTTREISVITSVSVCFHNRLSQKRMIKREDGRKVTKLVSLD